MTIGIESDLQRLKTALIGRDREGVNTAATALLEARAPLGRQWHAVSAALARNGEIHLAVRAMDALVEAAQGSPHARFQRAVLFAQSGWLAAAEKELQLLPPDVPDQVSNAYLHGTLALNQGQRDTARDHLERAVDLQLSSGQAWLALSEIVDFAVEPELANRLEEAWRAPPGQGEDLVTLGYAVGRLRHQLGDHAGAFAAFARAAESKRASVTESVGDQEQSAMERSLGWPSELIDRSAERIVTDHSRIIFVSGLPRSGTTLMEQIFASHPQVQHGEELSLFGILDLEIGGVDAPSFSAWLDRGGDPNALVELYLHLASERIGEEGRFVDKTVEAGKYMGLLLALFPDAPIFWMKRDPVDNGWSAFRTYFARGASWSWDLKHVGQRLAQEAQMIAYWSEAGQDRLNFIDYEGLVRDPEGHIPRIAAAAGLTLEDGMLRPHETQRTVATASVSQVREPINLKGLGVAEPYRPWLSPMIDAYAEASVTKGSSARG